MRLYLIRHPRPVVDQGHCYGRSDVAVSADVLAACLLQLVAQLPRGVTIHSSPLRRCAGLAEALAPELDAADIAFDARLQEMHFGSWELRAWDDIPWSEVEAWNRDLAHHAPGGGETLVQVARRVGEAFDTLRLKGEDAVVVCHAGAIRMLRAWSEWQSSQAVDALAGVSSDVAALEMIAVAAAADRRAIGFGELVKLKLPAAAATGA